METIMSFFQVNSVTAYQPQFQSLSFDLEVMLEKAKAYANNDDGLFSFIQNILQNSKFQSNPKVYLDDWTKRRGCTEAFSFPDDEARGFFDENFKS